MKIIKKVFIKQVLTEDSKALIKERLEKKKVKLDIECQQLLFEQKKLINKMQHSKSAIKQRFHNEIKQRKEKITLIHFKIEQVDLLEIGSEVIEKEVEAIIDVEIGTSSEALMKQQSIIIKDGSVIRIDNE